MDDPISALDADVRKKVFSQVFMGLLANKTRVLVTHSIDFLQFADKVVILKQGEIKAQGTFNELQNDKYLREILSIHSDQIHTFQQTSKIADEPKIELEKNAEGPDQKDEKSESDPPQIIESKRFTDKEINAKLKLYEAKKDDKEKDLEESDDSIVEGQLIKKETEEDDEELQLVATLVKLYHMFGGL